MGAARVRGSHALVSVTTVFAILASDILPIFAIAAIPARYALERGAWAEAAALEPHPSAYPYTEALTYLARALGAAHTGNTAAIKASVEALQRITDALTAQRLIECLDAIRHCGSARAGLFARSRLSRLRVQCVRARGAHVPQIMRPHAATPRRCSARTPMA